MPAELECVSAAALANLENICSRVPVPASTSVPVEASSSFSSSSSSSSSSSDIATPSRKRPRDEGSSAAADGHDRRKAQLLASPHTIHGGGGGGNGRGRAVMSPTYGVGLFQEMAASIALLKNEISGSSAAR